VGKAHFDLFPTSAILYLKILTVYLLEDIFMQTAKRADSKGRIVLGASYANKMLLIEVKAGGDVLIKKAAVIPENESWLHKNKSALTSVMKGVEQAKHHKFSPSPMKNEKNMEWLDEIED
jgi:hypothetical protein